MDEQRPSSLKVTTIYFSLGTAETLGLCWPQLLLLGGEGIGRREKCSFSHWLNSNKPVQVHCFRYDENGENCIGEAVLESQSYNSFPISATILFTHSWEFELWKVQYLLLILLWLPMIRKPM